MTRRREQAKEDVMLTRDEVKTLYERLSKGEVAGLEAFYRSAHARCALQPWLLPSPRDVQELVQAWKILRKRRRGRSL